MTTRPGIFMFEIIQPDDYIWPFPVTIDLLNKENLTFPISAVGIPYISDVKPNGHKVDTQPISSRNRTSSGGTYPFFLYDFYNRAHVIPATENVGKVLNDQTFEVYVWSAYFSSKSGVVLEEEETDGIELDKPPGWENFTPMEGKTFTAHVSNTGPIKIAATYSFDFGDSKPQLRIVGDRGVYVWPFRSDAEMTESLEWKTDVVPSYEAEQRIKLREYPRKSLVISSSLLCPDELSRAKSLAEFWVSYSFAVPVWNELSHHKCLPTGTTTIELDTDVAKYVVGDSLIVWSSSYDNESATIKEVNPGEVVLERALIGSYSKCVVTPLNIGKTFQSIDFDLPVGVYTPAKVTATFISLQNQDYSDVSAYPTYKDVVIMNDPFTSTSNLSEKIVQDIDIIDFEVGQMTVHRKEKYARHRQTISWVVTDRAALWKIKSFIYSSKGKLKSFLLPSFENDIGLVGDQIFAGDTSILINDLGFNKTDKPFFLFIKMKDGQEYYNKVYQAAASDNYRQEALFLIEVFGVDIYTKDIAYISVMKRVRFNSDKVDFSYDNEVTTIQVPTTTVNADESD